MLSFGDALAITALMLFLVWLLKRLFPSVFGDFADRLSRARKRVDEREHKDQSPK